MEFQVELGVARGVGRIVEVRLLGTDDAGELVEVGLGESGSGRGGGEAVEGGADREHVADAVVVDGGHLRARVRCAHGETLVDQLLHRFANRAAADPEFGRQRRHAERLARGQRAGEDHLPDLPMDRLAEQRGFGHRSALSVDCGNYPWGR